MPWPHEGDGTLNKFFKNVKVGTFVRDTLNGEAQKVLILEGSTSIAQACRTLLQHNYLSAPVIDDTLPDDTVWYERYIGIVDLLTMVDWMIAHLEGSAPEQFEKLLELNVAFRTTPISQLAGSPRWCPFVPLNPTDHNLLDIMILLGKYAVHRAVVVNIHGDLSNVITQSALIQCLKMNINRPELEKVLSTKIADILQHQRKVITVNAKATFYDAFCLLSQNLISAVPVVDDHNVIVGNVSVKDFREMLTKTDQFSSLNKQIAVHDFDRGPVICFPTTTVREVVEKLSESHVHRVYAIDEAGHLKGVVSLRDIIVLFVKEPADSTLGEYFTDVLGM